MRTAADLQRLLDIAAAQLPHTRGVSETLDFLAYCAGWPAKVTNPPRRLDAGAMSAHISPLIKKEFVFQTENKAGSINRGTDTMELLARMIAGHKIFAAIFNPFHRPTQPHRGNANKQILRIEFAAHTEPAAHMAFVQYDTCDSAAEHIGNRITVSVRHLRGAV